MNPYAPRRTLTIVLFLVGISLPGRAEAQTQAELLARDLRATQIELEDVKKLNLAHKDFEHQLEHQRDDALKQLEKAPPALPWWVWTLAGGAVATILIRGVK